MLIKMVRRGWLIAVTVLVLLGCGEANHEDKLMVSTAQISAAEWQALAQKRVVFGHQSVGQGILNGVQSLAAQAGIGIQVKESRGAVADGAGIVHFSVGRNKFPDSKFKDFTETLENGLGNTDVALMKLCYVDFKADTDAKLLADQYSTMIKYLSHQFPHTIFVTVTTPLTTVQTGPIAWFKRSLGLVPDGYVENARRKEFNDLLRARYGQQGRLFDLAKIESEGYSVPDYQGRLIEVLNPALTTDGGHLNTEGEKQVAARLVKLLAALPSQ